VCRFTFSSSAALHVYAFDHRAFSEDAVTTCARRKLPRLTMALALFAGVGACASSTSDTESPNVVPPSFSVTPAALAFDAAAGAPLPAPQSVAISVGAGESVTGLVVSVTHPSGSTTGWLDASLSGATTPSTLSVRPSRTDLPPGTYRATVRIASPVAANSPQDVSVTYSIGTGPAIGLSPTSVAFGALVGGPDPGPQTVQVNNAGGGTLGGLGMAVSYAPNQVSGWLSAALVGAQAPTTVTLQATTRTLAAGTYGATVTVQSSAAGNSPQTIAVTLTVGSGPAIALSRSSVAFGATAGGASPASESITISNGGGGTLSGLAVGTITYGAGATGWLGTPSLSGATAPATLSLAPNTSGLAAGTYTASVPITSSATGISNSPQSIAVTLVVAPGAQDLVVTMAGSGASGTVTSSPTGIGCTLTAGVPGGDCTESLPFNTSVTLTASGTGGSTFTGWGGACTGSGSCQLTMSAARSVTASFVAPVVPGSLTLLQAPTNAADSVPFAPPPSVQVLDTQGRPYAVAGVLVQALLMSGNGTRIGTNTVVTNAAGVAAWTDFGLNAFAPPGAFVLRFALRDQPAVYVETAAFTVAAAAFVTARADGYFGGADLSPGGGRVSIGGTDCGRNGTCTVGMPAGTAVTVTATPDTNSFFVLWGSPGCPSGSTATCTFTATGNVSITALFALKTYVTEVTVVGPGADGTVTGSASPFSPRVCQLTAGVQSGNCTVSQFYGARGTSLLAQPGVGSVFVGWSGDCGGNSTSCTVAPLPGGTRRVTATFSR
jgi:hypothetical protein